MPEILFTESLLLRTKIAVAMAIIKSKPDMQSSRDYAERLWSMHQKSYQSLTTKCQLLSLELMSANHHQLNTLDGNWITPGINKCCSIDFVLKLALMR